MLRVSARVLSVAAGRGSAKASETPPISGCANPDLTSARGSGVYNLAAASGQRHDVRPAPGRRATTGSLCRLLSQA